MNKIKFSIIVPIYNVQNYLKHCVESIIMQSFGNIEIILVNDGSPDKCPLICEEYAKKDSRIQVIHKINGGLSDARNSGLEIAKGEYIIFVDSDDYIESDACEIFKDLIDSNDDIDIIAANIRTKYKSKIVMEMYADNQMDILSNGSDFLKFQLKNHKMYMSSCRNIYKRKFLINNQLYFKVGILHEDEQWTPRVFLLAKTVIRTKYAHYNRVLSENSITRQKNKTKNALDLISTCNELKIIYEGIRDEELKNLLIDYLVMLYLNAFYSGKLIGKNYNKFSDKNFLKGMAKTKKNIYKVRLFCFNKYLYYYVNLISKRII